MLMKNKKNIYKILLIFIVVVFIILFFSIFRKFIILSHLENISKDIAESDNYYVKTYALKENSIEIMKSYNKDAMYLSILETMDKNTDKQGKLTVYDDGKEKISIIEINKEKTAILGDKVVGGKIGINAYATYGKGFWSKLQLAILSNISTEYIGNKECYVVKSIYGWQNWIDKETGLIIRECTNGDITDFDYKFDVVQDEEITKPDMSDCVIQD